MKCFTELSLRLCSSYTLTMTLWVQLLWIPMISVVSMKAWYPSAHLWISLVCTDIESINEWKYSVTFCSFSSHTGLEGVAHKLFASEQDIGSTYLPHHYARVGWKNRLWNTYCRTILSIVSYGRNTGLQRWPWTTSSVWNKRGTSNNRWVHHKTYMKPKRNPNNGWVHHETKLVV